MSVITRPLCTVGFSVFAALMLICLSGSVTVAVIAAIAAVFSVILFLLRKKVRIFSRLCVIASAVLFSCVFLLGFRAVITEPLKALDSTALFVNATVVSQPETNGVFTGFTVKSRVTLPDGRKRNVKFYIMTESVCNCKIDDTIACNVQFSKITGDSKRYEYPENIFISGYVSGKIEITGSRRPTPASLAVRLRDRICKIYRESFSEDISGVMCSVALGDKSQLPDSLMRNMSESGIGHMAAVSGLHVSLVGIFLLYLLRLFIKSGRLRYILSCGGVWFFTLMTGFAFSAIRAAVMFSFISLAKTMRRRSDPVTSLAAALLLISIACPYAAADIGLLCSASSTLGLILFMPKISAEIKRFTRKHPKLSFLKPAMENAGCSMCATASLIPCQALFFHKLSFVTLPANLLIVPAAPVIVICGVFGGLLNLSPLLGFIAKPFLLLGALAAKYVAVMAGFLANLPFSVIYSGYLSLIIWCIIFVSAAAAYVLRKSTLENNRKKYLSLTAAICAAVLAASCVLGVTGKNNAAEFCCFRAGKSLCAAVIFNRHAAVIGSPMTKGQTSEIVSALNDKGVYQIDYLFIPDSASEFGAQMLSGSIAVKNVICNTNGRLPLFLDNPGTAIRNYLPPPDGELNLFKKIKLSADKSFSNFAVELPCGTAKINFSGEPDDSNCKIFISTNSAFVDESRAQYSILSAYEMPDGFPSESKNYYCTSNGTVSFSMLGKLCFVNQDK